MTNDLKTKTNSPRKLYQDAAMRYVPKMWMPRQAGTLSLITSMNLDRVNKMSKVSQIFIWNESYGLTIILASFLLLSMLCPLWTRDMDVYATLQKSRLCPHFKGN